MHGKRLKCFLQLSGEAAANPKKGMMLVMTDSSFAKISIRKKTIPEWAALFILFFPFCLSFLTDFLHVPAFIKYTLDIAWVTVFFCLFIRKKVSVNKKMVPFVGFVILWLIYVFVTYMFHFQSLFYFLWGLRNNLRFYIAFLGFAAFCSEEAVSSCFRFIDCLFWINTGVSFVQFFVWGYQQDFLGGIFGVGRGCNGYTIILFIIVVTRSILLYLNEKESAVKCFLKGGVSLIIAAMAELKFFFVFFVLILIVSMVLTKFSWRKLLILLGMAVLLTFAGSLLTAIFGENEKLTLERIMELVTSTNYSTAKDLGRLTAIPTLSKTLLSNLSDRIFGLGLGNCDTSAFAICNTPFYQMYQGLHYSWFSSAFLFLETGYIGLIFNLSFFVMCFVLAYKNLKKKESNPLFDQMAVIMALCCILLTFYNSSMRMEISYAAYFVLALPFVSADHRIKRTAARDL